MSRPAQVQGEGDGVELGRQLVDPIDDQGGHKHATGVRLHRMLVVA